MDMRSFLHTIEPNRIDEPVDKKQELTRHLYYHQTEPFLFDDVDGAQVIGNLWSTHDRVADALGIDRDALIPTLLDAIAAPAPVERVAVGDAPFTANQIDDNALDLQALPIPTYFPKDGGPYLTSAVVTAERDGVRNMSFHRCMVRNARSMSIRLVPRHLHQMYEATLPEELPIGIAIGVNPAALLAGAVSTDYETDELEIASAILRATHDEPLAVFELPNGVRVPADAEYVLEGRLTAATAPEGPFVDITGTYDIVRTQPIVEIDRIYHRDAPIFHALLPGGREHFLLMGLPREATIYEQVSTVTTVNGVRLTPGGCSWLHGAVSITKAHDDDGRRAIERAMAGHTSMKHLVIVDDDIDVDDPQSIEFAVATRFQAYRDLHIFKHVKGSSLDPSGDDGIMTKLGFDATVPVAEREKYRREQPPAPPT